MEDHLLLNENAHIFKKPTIYSLNKTKVKQLFANISKKQSEKVIIYSMILIWIMKLIKRQFVVLPLAEQNE